MVSSKDRNLSMDLGINIWCKDFFGVLIFASIQLGRHMNFGSPQVFQAQRHKVPR